MKPWEESYQTRTWKAYKITYKDRENKKSTPPCGPDATDLKVCEGESEMALELKDDPNRFYSDWEQVAAGLDKIYGVSSLSRLTSDWNGHKKGSLVFAVYAGVTENPPCSTYLVETKKQE